MRIKRSIAVVGLLPLCLAGGFVPRASGEVIAPRAANAESHLVSLSGTLKLNDHETFGSDEHAEITIQEQTYVSHSRPRNAIVVDRCVGGEVRGQLIVDLKLRADDSVVVSPVLNLYEGSSCSTTDLDGRVRGNPFALPKGWSVSWNDFKTHNRAEGVSRDWASVDFTVTQTVRG